MAYTRLTIYENIHFLHIQTSAERKLATSQRLLIGCLQTSGAVNHATVPNTARAQGIRSGQPTRRDSGWEQELYPAGSSSTSISPLKGPLRPVSKTNLYTASPVLGGVPLRIYANFCNDEKRRYDLWPVGSCKIFTQSTLLSENSPQIPHNWMKAIRRLLLLNMIQSLRHSVRRLVSRRFLCCCRTNECKHRDRFRSLGSPPPRFSIKEVPAVPR
jgi:hypothetical protein